jgi:hypothetical protein
VLLDGTVLGETTGAAAFSCENSAAESAGDEDDAGSEAASTSPAEFESTANSARVVDSPNPVNSDARQAPVAHENGAEGTGGDSQGPSPARIDPGAQKDVILAMRRLGFGARETRAHVQAALDHEPDKAWTAEGLLRAALVAS